MATFAPLLDEAGSSGSAVASSAFASDATAAVVPPSPWRYWILATYSMLAAMQGLTWSVPGTLAPTFLDVYGMDQDTVQLLLNYGPIFYVLCMLPVMYALDRYGIRLATTSGLALVLVANVMRCFASDASELSVAIVHISFILNASAGPAAMAVPSKLAEVRAACCGGGCGCGVWSA